MATDKKKVFVSFDFDNDKALKGLRHRPIKATGLSL